MPQIEKLKTRFSGRQKSNTPEGKDVKPNSTDLPNDVASLEAAVAAQVFFYLKRHNNTTYIRISSLTITTGYLLLIVYVMYCGVERCTYTNKVNLISRKCI